MVSTQNHDQVGNRAVGERTSALMSDGRLRVAAALLLTSPFVPLLFQGEEWGATTPFQYFTDHTDPELGRAVSEGRRREFAAFGWDPQAVPDPQDPATFERSKLDWTEEIGSAARQPAGLVPTADRAAAADPGAHRSPAGPHPDRVRPRRRPSGSSARPGGCGR